MARAENPAHRLAAYLEGSTNTVTDEWARELGFKDAHEAEAAVEDYVFLCPVCGWWCSTDEMGSEGACNECEDQGERA